MTLWVAIAILKPVMSSRDRTPTVTDGTPTELSDEQLEKVVGGVKTPISPNHLYRRQPIVTDTRISKLPASRRKGPKQG